MATSGTFTRGMISMGKGRRAQPDRIESIKKIWRSRHILIGPALKYTGRRQRPARSASVKRLCVNVPGEHLAIFRADEHQIGEKPRWIGVALVKSASRNELPGSRHRERDARQRCEQTPLRSS
jgi:hypothetical protein